jgi:hypothetical protein
MINTEIRRFLHYENRRLLLRGNNIVALLAAAFINASASTKNGGDFFGIHPFLRHAPVMISPFVKDELCLR